MLYSILFNSSPGVSATTRIILFVSYAFAVIFALSLHEFAHAVCAYKLGDKTAKLYGRLTLNPMAHFDITGLICFLIFGFGWAKPVPINPFNFKNIKRDTFLTSISGIALNLIVAFFSFPLAVVFSWHAGDTIVMLILYYFFLFLYQTNLVFAVFNLLPIYPLDGFNAISSHLKYNNKFVLFMQRYGFFVLMGVVILFSFTNIFDLLVNYVGYPISKFWQLILF